MLIDLDEMATQIGMSRKFVRDRVVKRPDFPPPAMALSQKTRRWDSYAFEAWVAKQAKKMAR